MSARIFDVYFDGAFVGYAWADSAWSAIRKVAGELACDPDGERDYRYTAASSTPVSSC